MATVIDSNDLILTIFKFLTEELSTPHIAFYLKDGFDRNPINSDEGFNLIKNQNYPKLPPAIARTSPLSQELEGKKEIVLKNSAENKIKVQLDSLCSEAAIPCFEENKLIAFILLDGKPSKYKGEDLDLLKIIAAQTTLVLERIKPYQQIHQDLEKSRKAAEESARLAALSNLIQGLAHELRNPLAIMLSRAELVKKQIDNKESVLKFADMTIRNIIRLLRLIEIMLSFGKKATTKETFDVNSTIEDVLLLIEGECGNKDIRIIKELRAKSQINGEEAQINEVILNMALNAIQAMEISSEKTLSIQSQDIQSNTKAGMKNAIEIIISDSGCGIKEEDLPKIFNPFFTTKPKGCGLGLSVAKRIVEENNGTLKIESAKEKGTRAILVLPAMV
ncbi:MAG: hypothetical protein HQ564_01625 [Candidatus Saganbacteria bacterium]|nr:hypothetical protein [Candidatus Saganbacteria bacterium]